MPESAVVRRAPITDSFFQEIQDEDFQRCLEVLQELQQEVRDTDSGVLEGLLRHFHKDKPVESLCELWQEVVDDGRQIRAPTALVERFLQCACTCCRMRNLELRMAALEVWMDLEKYTMIEGCPPRLLDQLLPTLLHNMALAEEDFLKEPPAVLEDAALVDLLKCRLQEGLDLEPIQSSFTARQRAASALDTLSIVLQEPLLTRVLPMIRSKLAEGAWELRELAVLALGAVAGAINLKFLLVEDVKALLSACDAPQGLLRCTALWAASRFVPLLVEHQEACPESQELLDQMREVFFSRLKDPNSKVKSAAATGVCELLEKNSAQLRQHEEWILEEMQKGIRSAAGGGGGALPALCDSVTTMLEQRAGKRLQSAGAHGGLLAELNAQLDGATDATSSCIFEAFAAFASGWSDEFLAICPKIARHAVRVIRNGIYPAPAAAACTSTEVPHVEDGIPVTVCSITGATLLSVRLDGDLRGAELRDMASRSLNGRHCKLVVADQILPEHLSLSEFCARGTLTELILTAIVVPSHEGVNAALDFLECVVEEMGEILCNEASMPWKDIVSLAVECLEEEHKMPREVLQSTYCLLGTLCKSEQEVLDAHLRSVRMRLPKLLVPGIRRESQKSVCNNAIWVTICWNRLFAEIDLPVEDSCSLGAALQHIAKSKESLLRDQRRMACVAWSLIAARVPEVARNLESIIKCWLLTMTAGEDEVDVEAWAGFSVAAKSQPEILVSHANELKRTIQSVRRNEMQKRLRLMEPHFEELLTLCEPARTVEQEAMQS